MCNAEGDVKANELMWFPSAVSELHFASLIVIAIVLLLDIEPILLLVWA